MDNNQETKPEATAKEKPKKAAKAAAPAQKAPPPMTAAQKLEALENAFMTQNQQIEILAEDLDSLRQQIIVLNKRLNASIKAAEDGEVSGEAINKIILGENMKELQGRVEYLKEQGVLVQNDDAEVSDQQFIVGRELDNEGNVTNPRVQFSVQSVDPTLKNSLYGKKLGAVVAYSETEDSLEITEVYDIVAPTKKKNFEQQSPEKQ